MSRRASFVAVLVAILLLPSSLASAAGGLAPDSLEFVLVASWQPGFCATDDGRDKNECDALDADRFDATHFALHGLWPDDLDDRAIYPCYCDRGEPVSCERSEPADRRAFVSDEIFKKLKIVMPGARSGLHRHEWSKHGSCYEDDKSGADRDADPDEYFSEAMALLEALNASPVRALFADHLGGNLSRQQIEAAFDRAFGKGAGKRVLVQCRGSGRDRIITELRIGLSGDVTEPADLASLILAAPPTSAWTGSRSCTGGRVVEAEGN